MRYSCILSLLCVCSAFAAHALTVSANGYVWNYRESSGGVELYNPHADPDELASNGYSTDPQAKNSVTIPSSIRGKPVTKLGHGLFIGCSGITSVNIPSSVKEIGSGAFCGCSKMTSVTIPAAVSEIGQCAFLNCNSLRKMTILSPTATIADDVFPEGLKKNGVIQGTYYANGYVWNFRTNSTGVELYCPNAYNAEGKITDTPLIRATDPKATGKVVIPQKIFGMPVTKLGNCLFYDCRITSVEIPATVTEIGEYAFYWTDLRSVKLPRGVYYIGRFAFKGCQFLVSVEFSEALQTICDEAFFGCEKLSKIELPSGIFFICRGAFANTALERVVIPERVEEIGARAFYGCSQLTTVVVKSSKAYIGDFAFPAGAKQVSANGILDAKDQKAYDDWTSSSTERHETTRISVGEESLDCLNNGIWEDEDGNSITFPYWLRKSNGVVRKTAGGIRLDLFGASIGHPGIFADGDLAIHLDSNNVIMPDGVYITGESGILTYGNLLVFGTGNLTIAPRQHPSGGAFCWGIDSHENVSVSGGAILTLRGLSDGIIARGTACHISLSSVGFYQIDSTCIAADNCYLLGSAISMLSYGDGMRRSYATDGELVIDGCAVSAVTEGTFCSYARVVASHSYFSVLSLSTAFSSPLVSFDNCCCRGCAVRSFIDSSDLFASSALLIGEGDYLFASKLGRPIGLNAFSTFVLNGGDVSVWCNSHESAVVAQTVGVMDGRLRCLDDISLADEVFFDAELAMAFSIGLAASPDNLIAFAENFYSQTFMDAIIKGEMSTLEGSAAYLTSGSYYYQEGGTVLSGGSSGVYAEQAVVEGGSLQGPVTVTDPYMNRCVVNTQGQRLCLCPYNVHGVAEGEEAVADWSGILPGYYGTQGLFVDSRAMLYFWIPESALPKLTVKPNNSKYGSASGSGTYASGKLVQLKATAKEGYVFTGWFTDKDCTKKLNPEGYDNRKPTIKITMPAKATTIYAKFNSVATDKSGLKFSDSTKKLAKTAKAYAAGAKVSLALGFSSKSYPKVTASGLPDGLAIDAITGKITGTVKKPGAYTVKVTVTSAAGNKITQNVKIDVKAPSWSTGTFSGYGAVVVKGKTVPVSSTFTATAVGKVSGKVIYKGRSAPFTASYASATDTEARFTVGFSADGVAFKSAMSIKQKTSGLTYTRAHALKADSFELELQKVVPLVEKGKSLEGLIGKSYTFKYGYENAGLTKSGDKLVVKFADKDVVKLSGIAGGKSFSGLSASVMACGKSKKDGTTKYKLNVPVVEGTVGYYRLLTFKVTIDTETKKVTKIEKSFAVIE